VSASPLLYKARRSRRSLFSFQLFLSFFWYIFVLKTLAWRGKKQSDKRDRREAGKFCVERRRKWDTQRFGTRIPRILGLAPAPGMHRFLCPLFRCLFPFDHFRPFRAIDDVLLGCEVVEDVLVIREFLEDFRLRAFWVSVARLTLRSKLLYVFYYFTCPKVPLCFAHLFSLSRLTLARVFINRWVFLGYCNLVWDWILLILWIEGEYVHVSGHCSRVCGNSHGMIRKYGLNTCRQCFRIYSKDIGFVKVSPLTCLSFLSRSCTCIVGCCKKPIQSPKFF
jgi:ribosomal protein S14